MSSISVILSNCYHVYICTIILSHVNHILCNCIVLLIHRNQGDGYIIKVTSENTCLQVVNIIVRPQVPQQGEMLISVWLHAYQDLNPAHTHDY